MQNYLYNSMFFCNHIFFLNHATIIFLKSVTSKIGFLFRNHFLFQLRYLNSTFYTKTHLFDFELLLYRSIFFYMLLKNSTGSIQTSIQLLLFANSILLLLVYHSFYCVILFWLVSFENSILSVNSTTGSALLLLPPWIIDASLFWPASSSFPAR